MTLGLDGDDLLFGGGIYVEKLGVIGTTGWSIYDRDWSAGVTMTHESNGYTAVKSMPSFQTCAGVPTYHQGLQQLSGTCYGGSASHPADFSLVGLALSSQRNDGYSDGPNVLQGVRAYDPNMNQWTTPDAYAGDVHDPMSQKPYMWNGNNPVQYSDPSGYVTVAEAAWSAAKEAAPALCMLCSFVAGMVSDGRTVADSKAPTSARVVAGISLALTVVPDAKGVEALIRAAADRFAVESAANGVTKGSVKMVLQSADKVKIQYRDANGVRRDVMAHNAHPNEPGTNPHTQPATKNKTDAGSHQDIPN